MQIWYIYIYFFFISSVYWPRYDAMPGWKDILYIERDCFLWQLHVPFPAGTILGAKEFLGTVLRTFLPTYPAVHFDFLASFVPDWCSSMREWWIYWLWLWPSLFPLSSFCFNAVYTYLVGLWGQFGKVIDLRHFSLVIFGLTLTRVPMDLTANPLHICIVEVVIS